TASPPDPSDPPPGPSSQCRTQPTTTRKEQTMKHLAITAKRVGSGLTSLLLLAVTLASFAYIAPSFFGYERYVITGGSMSGTFEKGSIAFEKPVPVEDLAVGDVITYMPPAD